MRSTRGPVSWNRSQPRLAHEGEVAGGVGRVVDAVHAPFDTGLGISVAAQVRTHGCVGRRGARQHAHRERDGEAFAGGIVDLVEQRGGGVDHAGVEAHQGAARAAVVVAELHRGGREGRGSQGEDEGRDAHSSAPGLRADKRRPAR